MKKTITFLMCFIPFIYGSCATDLELPHQPKSRSFIASWRNVIDYAVHNPIKTIGAIVMICTLPSVEGQTHACHEATKNYMGVEGKPIEFKEHINISWLSNPDHFPNVTVPEVDCVFLTPRPFKLSSEYQMACCNTTLLNTSYGCIENLMWYCKPLTKTEIVCVNTDDNSEICSRFPLM